MIGSDCDSVHSGFLVKVLWIFHVRPFCKIICPLLSSPAFCSGFGARLAMFRYTVTLMGMDAIGHVAADQTFSVGPEASAATAQCGSNALQ
jgi:hypothetical protein